MIIPAQQIRDELLKLEFNFVHVLGRDYLAATLPWLEETAQWYATNPWTPKDGVGDCVAATVDFWAKSNQAAMDSRKAKGLDFAAGICIVRISNFNSLGYDTTKTNGHALGLIREEREWFILDRQNGFFMPLVDGTLEREDTGVADFTRLDIAML